MASRQVMIARTAVAGTSSSPLPCHALHGYMVTSAHRVEVEVEVSPSGAPGTEICMPKTLRTGFLRRRSIMWTFAAIPCRSSGCGPPPGCVAFSLTPKGGSRFTKLVDYHQMLDSRSLQYEPTQQVSCRIKSCMVIT
jgi:hypothetical protein